LVYLRSAATAFYRAELLRGVNTQTGFDGYCPGKTGPW